MNEFLIELKLLLEKHNAGIHIYLADYDDPAIALYIGDVMESTTKVEFGRGCNWLDKNTIVELLEPTTKETTT